MYLFDILIHFINVKFEFELSLMISLVNFIFPVFNWQIKIIIFLSLNKHVYIVNLLFKESIIEI